jgi:hypothetical protein
MRVSQILLAGSAVFLLLFHGLSADLSKQSAAAANSSVLPNKLVITDRRDISMPQYAAVLHWDFPGKLDESTFAFSPPSGAQKIVMADVRTMEEQMRKGEKVQQ